MPKMTISGQPRRAELPAPLRLSSVKAQRTFAEAHDSALAEYGGDEGRAHRVAYAALEHKFERDGDRWVARSREGA
jgi:cation transport regulator ChaB